MVFHLCRQGFGFSIEFSLGVLFGLPALFAVNPTLDKAGRATGAALAADATDSDMFGLVVHLVLSYSCVPRLSLGYSIIGKVP